MSYDLRGKAAFVTGAARGIGLETARALHTRGASVALVDLDATAAAEAAAGVGDRAIGLEADVCDAGGLDTAPFGLPCPRWSRAGGT
jgi:NAD(P)-dependent dehydrogenase (short-subunit alcohol dehydrogenase family)